MSKLLIVTILMYAPASTVLAPKKTKLVTKVNVQNTCAGTYEKFLIENGMDKKPENGITKYEFGPSEGSAYQLVICTKTQCYRYGNMTFLLGREYNVKISECNLPGAKIESHETSTSKLHSPPQIRFRSRRVSPTEYRNGQTRFRRLSVGMSKYSNVAWPPPEGGATIQFRYRMMPDGPVSYMSTHKLMNLNPGHKYFVEVEYFGSQREVIKIQDEGLSIPLAR